SLSVKSGCIHWAFRTRAAVRAAVSIGKLKNGRFAAYVADLASNVYALDAESGRLLWETKADHQNYSRITGAPLLVDDRIYLPMSEDEEALATDWAFECCKSRGGIVALNAQIGKPLWRTSMVEGKLHSLGKNAKGTPIWGPAGVGIWSSPTFDPK